MWLWRKDKTMENMKFKVLLIEDDAIQVKTQNTSIEIGSDDTNDVFNSFVQSDVYAGPVSQGDGLGLCVAKQLILAQCGQIWAESTPEQGSVFCFSLPKCKQQTEANAEESMEVS